MPGGKIDIDNPHGWVSQHVVLKSLALDAEPADRTHRPEELAHASSAGCGFALRRPFYPSITVAPRKVSTRSPRSGPKTQPTQKAQGFRSIKFLAANISSPFTS